VGWSFGLPGDIRPIRIDHKEIEFQTCANNSLVFSFPHPHPDHFQTVLATFLLENLLFAKKLFFFLFDHFN
jgi:hypothetical protein